MKDQINLLIYLSIAIFAGIIFLIFRQTLFSSIAIKFSKKAVAIEWLLLVGFGFISMVISGLPSSNDWLTCRRIFIFLYLVRSVVWAVCVVVKTNKEK